MNIKEISISVEQEQSVSLDVNQEKNVDVGFEKREVVSEERVEKAYHDYDFSFNKENGKLKLKMIANNGKEKTIEVDLPTEELVKNVGYNNETQEIIIEWENGQKTPISLKGLVDVYKADNVTLTLDKETNTFKINEEYLTASNIKVDSKKANVQATNVESAIKELKDDIQETANEIKDGVVTGIKGSSENEYRKGQVEITKENIGLGNVLNVGSYSKEESDKKYQVQGDYATRNELPTTLPASDVYAWAKEPIKPTYNKQEIGLGNVDNTSDIDKPISTDMKNALDLKEDKSNLKALAYRDSLSKSDVGLDKVNNVAITEEQVAQIGTNKTDIATLNQRVGNLTGSFQFKGELGSIAELPTASSSNAGYVYIIGNLEYVSDGTKWIELGDEGSFVLKTTYESHLQTQANKDNSQDEEIGNIKNNYAKKEDIPTKTSQLENDSSYATTSQLFSKNYNDLTNKPSIPTKTSQLNNDSGFLTQHQDISGLATKKELQDTSNAHINSMKKQFALGYSQENISATSNNDWQLKTSSLGNVVRAVTYGNGYWVAVGAGGITAYSTDTTNWTSLTPFATTGTLTGVTYGNGRFIIVEHCTTYGKIWSADKEPINWTNIYQTAEGYPIEGIRFINDRFFAVGAGGFLAYSLDGKEWTEVSSSTDKDIIDIAYGNGKYVACCYGGVIVYSYNGNDWYTSLDSSFTTNYRHICFGNNMFVAGGQKGVMRYSNDGINWYSGSSNGGSNGWVRGIAYSNKRFFAVKYGEPLGEALYSQDGINWTSCFSITNQRLWCLTEYNGIFLVGGSGGIIYTLDLGIEWLESQPKGQHIYYRFVLNKNNGNQVIGESYYQEQPDLSNYPTKDEVVRKITIENGGDNTQLYLSEMAKMYFKGVLNSGEFVNINNHYVGKVQFVGSGVIVYLWGINTGSGKLVRYQSSSPIASGQSAESITYKTDFIQLTAGEGITIENGVISANVDLSNYATKGELFSKDYNDLNNKPTIPTKMSELTQDVEFGVSEEDVLEIIERNSEETQELKIGTSTDYDPTSDDEVITSKAVHEHYSLLTESGNQIDLAIDPTTYVMTVSLKNKAGETISTDNIDLPLESMVISARYSNGKLYLTTKDGSELEGIDISNIVSGLVPDTRKINGKPLSSDITIDVPTKTSELTNDSNYATTSQLFSKNYNDLTNKPTIPTKVSELDNDKNYLTSFTETDPTVPSHIKNITTTDITNWNNKSTFSGNYNDLTNKPNLLTKDDVVNLTDNQTISGVKTFNETPLVKIRGSKLPIEYQEVEYIESTGTQFIKTGFAPRSNKYRVVLKFMYPRLHNGLSLFGNSTGAPYSITVYGGRPTFYVGKSNDIICGDSTEIGTLYTLDATADNGELTAIWNGVKFSNTYYGNLNTISEVFIFGSNAGGNLGESDNGYMLYSMQMYDNDVLMRNFIPCYRKSDNVIGLYDAVTKTFYTNAGTGTFTKGNNVTVSYGTSEVATTSDIPTKTSQLTNDSNYAQTSNLKTINGQSIVGTGDITIESGSSETPEIEVTSDVTSVNIVPNVYYNVLSRENELTLVMGGKKAGIFNEYSGQIQVDETPITVQFTEKIRWNENGEVTKEDSSLKLNGKNTYLFSIVNGIGLITNVANEELESFDLTLDGLNLSWTSVNNADSYDIYANEELIIADYNSTSVDLTGYIAEYGTTNIKVVAKSKKYTDSYATVTYTKLIQLETPTNIVVSDTQISWDSVPNAVSYNVYSSNSAGELSAPTSPTNVTTNYYNPPGIVAGSYYFKISAVGEGIYSESELSELITWVKA